MNQYTLPMYVPISMVYFTKCNNFFKTGIIQSYYREIRFKILKKNSTIPNKIHYFKTFKACCYVFVETILKLNC